MYVYVCDQWWMALPYMPSPFPLPPLPPSHSLPGVFRFFSFVPCDLLMSTLACGRESGPSQLVLLIHPLPAVTQQQTHDLPTPHTHTRERERTRQDKQPHIRKAQHTFEAHTTRHTEQV